jgi:hypothetical protein
VLDLSAVHCGENLPVAYRYRQISSFLASCVRQCVDYSVIALLACLRAVAETLSVSIQNYKDIFPKTELTFPKVNIYEHLFKPKAFPKTESFERSLTDSNF